ncbi:MAG: aspartate--tRNA ligase [bacterium]|nr:aspartate--tRNA ligase [bacterium]
MTRTLTKETPQKVGEKVILMGWVHKHRRLGKLVFFDLRDRWGVVQVVVREGDALDAAKKIRPEFVIRVEGLVKARGEKNVNKDSPMGAIEIEAQVITIITEAQTPPFEIENENLQANEELRMQYRYLDLRHERMRKNIMLRHRVIHFIRNYLTDHEFVEVQTPILTKSTPEGARDYLVPSRLHNGKFFALPQSPQQYKQLLMVAGFERYFQIAPCFRDEDARADRSPGEFYQLDLEMSFITQEDILQLAEGLFIALIEHLNEKLGKKYHFTQKPFPRLSHADAVKQYGKDKFDMRKDKNDPTELAFAWVLDFPLFTKQTEEDYFHGAGKTLAPSHHMFTAPKEEDVPLLDTDPGKVRAYQHDLVLNGFEVGGGSVRIHDPKIQEKIFDLIGFTEKQKKNFHHMLEAFTYGVPPHGGIAPGIDRLVMLLAGEKNLREVVAFPLTGDGRDPMMGSPSEVEKEQLDELGIQIIKT